MQNFLKLHEPVLVNEVLEALRVNKLALSKNQAPKYIDATVGSGGHTIEILKRKGDVLGIEVDASLLKIAKDRIKKACPPRLFTKGEKMGQFDFVLANFKDLGDSAKVANFVPVDGVIFDLGISSVHYQSRKRGFSFNYPDAPLDMRLDAKNQGVTAADLLNGLREDQLVDLFSAVLGKSKAKSLAEKVIERRKVKRFKLVADLTEIIGRKKTKQGKLNPATLPFMALRIAVNNELENLKEGLKVAFALLKKEGRLVVISFHSGEDRLVKRFFRKMQERKVAKIVTNKPITPTLKEVKKNPKARSAKLRILAKI